ncbi:MAG: DUF6049 family protein [Ferrimicrobium sp.]|jgi:hypothetical protein|nr:DUF6049 family protein [Ferrimicrobium sp.]
MPGHERLAAYKDRITLTQAPGVVSGSGPLSIDFRFSGTTNNAEAFLVVYPSTSSRSQLRQTLHQGPGGSPLALSRPMPLANIRGSGGGYRLRSPIFSDISCGADCAGVYPVELRIANSQTGVTVSQVILGIPFFPSGDAATTPLGVAAVLHVELPASAKTVDPALVNLSSSPAAASISVGGRLGTSIADQIRYAKLVGPSTLHQRILSPYASSQAGCANPQFSSLIGFGARLGLSAQVNGTDTGAAVFDTVPSRAELGALHRQRVSVAVVPDTVLGKLASVLSVSDPAHVRTMGLTLLGSSQQLSTELANATTPDGYQRLLADLAQFYFQAPAQNGRVATMGVNVTTPQQLQSLVAVLDRLHSTSLFQLETLSQAANLPSSQIAESDLSLATSSPHCPTVNRSLRSALNRLSGLTSADTGSHSPLNGLIGLAQLATGREPTLGRQAAVSLEEQERRLLANVQLVGSRTITLTSHSVSVPLTLSSTLPFPISVKMSIHSSEIAFPKGSTRSLSLKRGTQTVALPVVVKALGTFAASAVVAAPNGNVLLSTTLTVHSTGFSTVGIVLTVGAALVLISWWVRTARRHHKKPRDV